jgi:hypothetical protein
LWLHVISLALSVDIIKAKFASVGRWNPTWIPR